MPGTLVKLSRRGWLATAAAAPFAFGQEAGFTPLIDARSLSGWTIVDGPDSSFYVDAGSIGVSPAASLPTWLRSARQYENFELRGEFFIKGWTDSGLYFHAPEHGKPSAAGFQIKVFHQVEETPTPQSMGAVFPVLAPKRINVHEGWNDIRILMDWPRLQVWTNGEPVQDVDCSANEDLKNRLRRGYFGIVAASAACRFRNLRVKELPSKETWEALYEQPADLEAKWAVSQGKPNFITLGQVLRADGEGHLATRATYRDFKLQCYVRAAAQHNSGIIFRSSGRGQKDPKGYEIQLHNVEEAHFPTGSLYHHKRATYPRIEDEKWYLFELRVSGRSCAVRINGEQVMAYTSLDYLEPGFIELQAHRQGFWTEFKHILLQRL